MSAVVTVKKANTASMVHLHGLVLLAPLYFQRTLGSEL